MSRYDININDREKRDQTVWKRTVETVSHASDMGRIAAREAQLNSYHSLLSVWNVKRNASN